MGATAKDFRTNWASFADSPKERAAWLVRERAAVDRLRRRVGPLGQRLIREYAATGCTEAFAQASGSAIASYSGHHSETGFENKIFFAEAKLKNLAEFFSSSNHEGLHAIATAQCAAAHAVLYNKNARVVLCPEDDLRFRELDERNAYAKQAMLDAMLIESAPANVGCRWDSYLVDVFQHYRHKEPNLAATLRGVANMLMHSEMETGAKVKHHYNSVALQAYIGNVLNRPGRPLTFARMDADDAVSVGGSLGVSMFVPRDANSPLELSPENAVALSFVNRCLGIRNKNDLPTLAEALAARGMTKEDFLTESRTAPPVRRAGKSSASL